MKQTRLDQKYGCYIDITQVTHHETWKLEWYQCNSFWRSLYFKRII